MSTFACFNRIFKTCFPHKISSSRDPLTPPQKKKTKQNKTKQKQKQKTVDAGATFSILEDFYQVPTFSPFVECSLPYGSFYFANSNLEIRARHIYIWSFTEPSFCWPDVAQRLGFRNYI